MQKQQMPPDDIDNGSSSHLAPEPHSLMPPEILRRIFLWCCYDGRYDDNVVVLKERITELSNREFPQLAISGVCSQWRAVARSIPQLWNKVIFRCMRAGNIQIARQWLSRAGNPPVCIDIEDVMPETMMRRAAQDIAPQLLREPCLRNAIPESWVQKCVDSFLSSCRLKELKYPQYSDEPFPGKLPNRCLKGLQTLEIFSSSLKLPLFKPVTLDTARCPSLVRLSLWVPIAKVQPSITVRHLDVMSVSNSQFWDLLRGFPSLEEANFTISCDKTSTRKNVTHSSLKKVQLQFQSEVQVDLRHAIDPLILPELTDLTISVEDGPRWSPSAYSHMAQRSNMFPHLNRFEFSPSYDSDSLDIDSLLVHTPHAKSISVNSESNLKLSSETIAGLGSGRLCPNLEEIILVHIPNIPEFLEMVNVRQENAQRHGNGGGDGRRVKAFTDVYLIGKKPASDPGSLLQSVRKPGVTVDITWEDPETGETWEDSKALEDTADSEDSESSEE